MADHACGLRTCEAEAEELLQVQDQPGVHSSNCFGYMVRPCLQRGKRGKREGGGRGGGEIEETSISSYRTIASKWDIKHSYVLRFLPQPHTAIEVS